MSTKTAPNPSDVVIAKHRYRWTVQEIILTALFPALSVWFMVSADTNLKSPLWWGFSVLGWVGGGLLFNLGLTRKSASAIKLHQMGGQWVMERGGVISRAKGTMVTLKKVNDVQAVEGPYRTRDLSVSVVDRMQGTTIESIAIPHRLLKVSPEVRERLQPIVKAHARPDDTEAHEMVADPK